MKNSTINMIAALMFFCLGMATFYAIVRIQEPTIKVEQTGQVETIPSYVGVFYTDRWNTNQSEKIEINADGSCKLPGDWHNLANSECTYKVEGNQVYFYDSKNISATVGADGLVYGSYYFRRLK